MFQPCIYPSNPTRRFWENNKLRSEIYFFNLRSIPLCIYCFSSLTAQHTVPPTSLNRNPQRNPQFFNKGLGFSLIPPAVVKYFILIIQQFLDLHLKSTLNSVTFVKLIFHKFRIFSLLCPLKIVTFS